MILKSNKIIFMSKIIQFNDISIIGRNSFYGAIGLESIIIPTSVVIGAKTSSK